VYLLLLLVGSIGFIAMFFLGLTHGGGAHAHQALGGHAHGAGHVPALGGHHAAAGHHLPAGHHQSVPTSKGGDTAGKSRLFPAWLMISPLDIFSFSLGAGAAGLLFQSVVAAPFLPWVAVLGALVLNVGLVKPTMGFMMKFVSKPSEGLEGVLAHTATAMTRFDKSGRGLIALTLDDQNVQLLATLEDAEIHRGVQVNKGDEVVVIEVDSAKNTCRVSREL